jgi:hypothetical protein
MVVSQQPCYNLFMDAAMKAYVDRWQAVAEIEQMEIASASIDLRWQQLNAVVGLAIGLGILKADPSEAEGYLRWGEIKNRAAGNYLKP